MSSGSNPGAKCGVTEEIDTGLSRSKAGSRSKVMAMSDGTDVVEPKGAKSTQLTETGLDPEDWREAVAVSIEAGAGASAWSSSAVAGDGEGSVNKVVGLDR